MTVRECYMELQADYEGTLERLGSEELMERFALIFLEDDSFRTIKKGLEDADYQAAFNGAHTLKGVCLNLGFTKLFEVSEALTEALRNGAAPADGALFERVQEEYERTVRLLRKLQGENG